MKNSPLFDTAIALIDQSEEIINGLESIREKRPLTKREEEILKQEIKNKKAAYRMAMFG
jgi:capsule polysaccharide export protein KpsE/RkpR